MSLHSIISSFLILWKVNVLHWAELIIFCVILAHTFIQFSIDGSGLHFFEFVENASGLTFFACSIRFAMFKLKFVEQFFVEQLFGELKFVKQLLVEQIFIEQFFY